MTTVLRPDSENPRSPVTALSLGVLSRLAYGYERPDESIDMDRVETEVLASGFQTYRYIEGVCDGVDTQAIAVTTPGTLTIAFRGTEPDKIKDLATDAKFRKEPVSEAEGVGEVHRGFRAAMTPVWDEVLEIIEENAFKQLFLTGHSLGGALAMLCAGRAVQANHKVAALHTYGQPRTGDKEFARWLWKQVPEYYRWRNNNDIVTRIPLGSFGYEHSGYERYFNRNGNLKEYGEWMALLDRLLGRIDNLLKFVDGFRATDGFADHSMDNFYVPLLKRRWEGK